jgi:hypothetical protein
VSSVRVPLGLAVETEFYSQIRREKFVQHEQRARDNGSDNEDGLEFHTKLRFEAVRANRRFACQPGQRRCSLLLCCEDHRPERRFHAIADQGTDKETYERSCFPNSRTMPGLLRAQSNERTFSCCWRCPYGARILVLRKLLADS